MSNLPEIAIEFTHVGYQPGPNHTLVSDLNLGIKRGETVILLGRSGSGKTTCLKLINRMLGPTAGTVQVDGRDNSQWDVIRLRRHIGYAIQEVGLFPHYTVEQNVGLVPKLESWDRARVAARVTEVLKLVGMAPEKFARRYPNELSGGQKQRVGLARALAADPPILLMDEPFGALDPITRREIQQEFQELQRRLAKTVVFVTHDLGEAILLGNRIALLDTGTLKGIYTPAEFLSSKEEHVLPYVDAFRAAQQVSPAEVALRERPGRELL